MKREREAVEQVRRQLATMSIASHVERTAGNHLAVHFHFAGRPQQIIVSGSGDWNARRRSRTLLRHILNGSLTFGR
jgi:hypothetical protein